jgi:predicted transcriptional regulator
MFGLGKRRTKLGKFCDKNGISQMVLSKQSKVSRNAVADLCDGQKDTEPQEATIVKIISALRKLGYSVKANDFWDC